MGISVGNACRPSEIARSVLQALPPSIAAMTRPFWLVKACFDLNVIIFNYSILTVHRQRVNRDFGTNFLDNIRYYRMRSFEDQSRQKSSLPVLTLDASTAPAEASEHSSRRHQQTFSITVVQYLETRRVSVTSSMISGSAVPVRYVHTTINRRQRRV